MPAHRAGGLSGVGGWSRRGSFWLVRVGSSGRRGQERRGRRDPVEEAVRSTDGVRVGPPPGVGQVKCSTAGAGEEVLCRRKAGRVRTGPSAATPQGGEDTVEELDDVPRELCLECLHLGKFTEAVEAARRAVRVKRSEPGLQANLALALLLAGDVDEALDQAEQAAARRTRSTATSWPSSGRSRTGVGRGPTHWGDWKGSLGSGGAESDNAAVPHPRARRRRGTTHGPSRQVFRATHRV
jgi:hypothetical protein